MNNKLLKVKMIIIILSMSMLIFIFSFSVLFYSKYYPQKEMEFLSDFYSEYFLPEDSVNIETLRKEMKENNLEKYYIKYEYSNAKGCEFSKSFFSDVKVTTQIEPLSENNIYDNIAIVNNNNKNLCYEDKGKYYILAGADKFKVIGFFEDNNDEILFQTPYYININSHFINSKNDFDTIIIDFLDMMTKENTKEKLKRKLNFSYYLDWSGNINNTINISVVYFGVVALVAIVVFLNCVNFWSVWIDSFSYEFKIRKMIGATDKSNHILLLKHIISIFFIVTIISLILAYFIFILIKNSNFNDIRLLFGDKLHFLPLISSILVESMIITVITFIKIRFKKKVR